jgi:hypothetical protein
MSIIHDWIKSRTSLIATSFTLIATIGGAALFFDTTYAHAADVKSLIGTQELIIQNQERSQRQQLMFQVEYYDDRIKRLTAELAIAESLSVAPARAQGQYAQSRPVVEIRNELDDVKKRRELALQGLLK